MFLNVSKAFINLCKPLFGRSAGLLVRPSVRLSVLKLFKGRFSQFQEILNVLECFYFNHTPL